MSSSQNSNEYSSFLTDQMIEDQSQFDLLKYQKITGLPLSFPLFPDEIIEKLWSVSIQYSDDIPSQDGEKILACFLPEKKIIYVNDSMRGSEGRTSFTLAHEAGHVSLHSYLSKMGGKESLCRGELSLDQREKLIEKQADKYASALLMPKLYFERELEAFGYSRNSVLDLASHGQHLRDHFGVSHHALEIRLASLGIKASGGFYKVKSKKVPEKYFSDKEEERVSWSTMSQGRL